MIGDPELPRRVLEHVISGHEFQPRTGLEGLLNRAPEGALPPELRPVLWLLAIASASALAAVVVRRRRATVRRPTRVGPSARLAALSVVSVIAAVVAFAHALSRSGVDAAAGTLSITNPAPRGTLALHRWASEIGYAARARTEPLVSLDEEACLFLLEPARDFSPAEVDSLFGWVERGGVLFVAPGFARELTVALERWVQLDFERSNPTDVPGDRAVLQRGVAWRYRRLEPSERGMFDYPVEEVAVLGEGRVRDVAGEHRVLFARGGLGLLAEIFHGDGVMILLPEPDVLTNEGLPMADNVELLASLLSDWVPPGADIWFHEGVREGGRDG